jgi:parallel beta-helix repeat protein
MISNNELGITVYHGSYNKISGNNITNNEYYGIFIYFSGKNDIHQNNIIESGKRNAKFHYYIKNLKRNKWRENYWGSPRTSPYLIFGRISIWWNIGFGIIPWINIDWHPASEPYDIGV